MKIDNIKIKLPRTKQSLDKVFLNCEKRKKLIADTFEHYKQHLKKAKHDFSRADAEFKDECWDWTIIKAYYSIHHVGNALMSKKKGVFSKDHSCLIVALNHFKLIPSDLFLELINLHENFSEILSLDLTFQLRKISQYSVDEWEDLTKKDAKLVLDIAKKLIIFVEGEIWN